MSLTHSTLRFVFCHYLNNEIIGLENVIINKERKGENSCKMEEKLHLYTFIFFASL